MKISDIAKIGGVTVTAAGNLDAEVTGCYVSDLLSAVLANSKEGNLWITHQTHPNIVAVAAIRGLSAVLVTGGRAVEAESVRKAKAEGVNILSCSLPKFEIVGEVYCLFKAMGLIKAQAAGAAAAPTEG